MGSIEMQRHAEHGHEDEAVWPLWLPTAARHYLAHTEDGKPIREIAREAQVHPSTILRQIRKVEMERDDPLIDTALRSLARDPAAVAAGLVRKTRAAPPKTRAAAAEGSFHDAETMRILNRMAESGVALALAAEMEKGILVRESAAGQSPTRIAVVPRAVAERLVLQNWITSDAPAARVARYRISTTGKAHLRQLKAAGRAPLPELEDGAPRLSHFRSVMGASPLAALGRRKDYDGNPYLSKDLISIGERLREDFELANMGPGGAQDWARFLTGPADSRVFAAGGPIAAIDARRRLTAALRALGPGLGDVALQCCCHLEGIEVIERRNGWAARSGKVVLKIALERLAAHYRDAFGAFAPKVG
ncbi:hypothetical protein BVG79_01417 [Ketogulonicigenium robustum]|uniref:DUF6456 domain-containing protein n=1 Tax=Ketogulonicigenium robustum TaxID=92947 RepID=A0A1W6P036_9RHOB|nr:DUF6456 domain-containing protein [Ketogulonicigenium robustum]ARO14763.1 hypothetical protein BVG79_01417 [Ketogulonicigenium robustum]